MERCRYNTVTLPKNFPKISCDQRSKFTNKIKESKRIHQIKNKIKESPMEKLKNSKPEKWEEFMPNKIKEPSQRTKNDSPMAKLKNSKPTENKEHQAKRSQRIKNDSPMAKLKNSKPSTEIKEHQANWK